LSVIGIKSPGTGGIAIIVAAILGVLAVSAFVISRSLRDFKFPEINLPGLPDINLPGLPDITFPTINFPELPTIEFPDFSNIGQQITEAAGAVLNPQGAPTTESEGMPIDFTDVGMAAARGARGGATDEVLEEGVQAQPIGIIPTPTVQTTLETGQQFFGGGPSFIGGFVTETPVEFLSLNQILEMGLASSASEAASLRAEARGFTPEEEMFLMQGPVDVGGFMGGGPPAVSEERFEGLSLTEIALRLTGGPISNF